MAEACIKNEVKVDEKEDIINTNGIVNAPELKEHYAAAYLKNGVTRGITYQMKMLTWVAWNLGRREDINDWLLATEVRNARGFHDLVLKYKTGRNDDKYTYRFVQIKLKMSKKTTRINVNTMTSGIKSERQFSLMYLFKSYLNIIAHFENINPAQIKDFIIFTNRGIGESLKFLIPMNKNDEIIGFEKKGKQYRIDACMVQAEHAIMKALRQNYSNDGVILDFLKKVVFMVDQPPEPELEKLITEEIGKVYNAPQIFYNDFYKNITEWFLIYENGGKAPYLTQQCVIRYLANTIRMLADAREMKSIHAVDQFVLDKLQYLSL